MPSAVALTATFSQFSLTMPAAINTASHTGGVMVDNKANQKTKRCVVSKSRQRCCRAGPATDTKMI